MCSRSRPSGGRFWEVGISKPKTAVALAKQTECPVDLGWGQEHIPGRGRLRWELGMALPSERSRIIPGHYQTLAPTLSPAGFLDLGDTTMNQPALHMPSLGETDGPEWGG